MSQRGGFSYQVVGRQWLTGGVCLILAACGGGGGGSSASSPSPNPNASFSLAGVVAKGVLQNAIVTAYTFSSSGQRTQVGTPVRTDASGQYKLSLLMWPKNRRMYAMLCLWIKLMRVHYQQRAGRCCGTWLFDFANSPG